MTAGSVDLHRPIYYVRIATQGEASPTRVDRSDQVLTFSFEEDEKAADKLSITVDNFDLANFDDPVWRKGATIEVSWGYPGNMCPTRTCVIQKVTGFQTLTVEALAKSIEMHKVTQNRIFTNVTRAQAVAQIAMANGYGSSVQHIDDTSVVYETITQNRETDASFLMRLAKREGFEFFVDFDGLHWHRRRTAQKPLREFVYYIDQRGDVLDIQVTNDVTAKPAQVTLKGRDPITKKDIEVSADNSNTQRDGLAPGLEVVDPQTGLTSLQQNTGQQIEAHTSEPNAAGAQRVANGAYINSVMTTVELTLKAVGDPLQLAKTIVKISNIRSLSGNYYVSKVKHTIGDRYEMELKCKRDGRNAATLAKSDAKQNAQDPGEAGALEPREVVDPRTGGTSIQYVQSGGRPQGSSTGS